MFGLRICRWGWNPALGAGTDAAAWLAASGPKATTVQRRRTIAHAWRWRITQGRHGRDASCGSPRGGRRMPTADSSPPVDGIPELLPGLEGGRPGGGDGDALAGTGIASLARGARAVVNVPNPAMATASSLARASAMAPKTAPIARSAVALGRAAWAATWAARSALFMVSPPGAGAHRRLAWCLFPDAGSAGAAQAGHRMAMSAAVGLTGVRRGTVRFASIHAAPVRLRRPGRGIRAAAGNRPRT